MLDKLTAADFMRYLNQSFRIHYGGAQPLVAELIQVTEQPVRYAAVGRKPFSIVFRGPNGGHLPQSVYHIEHDALGALDLFIVPIGPDQTGMCYEAVFN